jgi:hypothetical protein
VHFSVDDACPIGHIEFVPASDIETLTAKARSFITSRGFTPGTVTIAANYVHVACVEPQAGGATVYSDGEIFGTN